jgi:REP element-mobilizing transposase RayT
MPDAPIFRYKRRLPHWRLPSADYMVGWSLSSSQPDLSAPERSIVMGAIRFFENERFTLHAFAVMNDHVHLLIKPAAEHPLKAIVHSIKSFSATRMCQDFQRRAPVWLREYWDRIVRNEADLRTRIDYILRNPAKRWPGMEKYPWCGVGKPRRNQ